MLINSKSKIHSSECSNHYYKFSRPDRPTFPRKYLLTQVALMIVCYSVVIAIVAVVVDVVKMEHVPANQAVQNRHPHANVHS